MQYLVLGEGMLFIVVIPAHFELIFPVGYVLGDIWPCRRFGLRWRH
jgi:hypothetical protein